MQNWPLRVLSFNPLSVSKMERLDELCVGTKDFDFVALLGTQRHKGEDKIESFMHRDTGKLISEAGWDRGWGTNRSAGVALNCDKKVQAERCEEIVDDGSGSCGERACSSRLTTIWYDCNMHVSGELNNIYNVVATVTELYI